MGRSHLLKFLGETYRWHYGKWADALQHRLIVTIAKICATHIEMVVNIINANANNGFSKTVLE